MRELVRLADYAEEFRKKGARIYALCAGEREELAKLQDDLGSGVILLADPEAAAIAAFGMLDPEPFPPGRVIARAGTVLIDAEGRVAGWWLTDNYRKRPDPAEILDAIP
ncbi:MAG: peroxiredoxin family protein [Planctomycetota bacterium]